MALRYQAVGEWIGQLPPPDGVTPDFVHPRDAGRVVNFAGLLVMVVAVTVFFLIRCYVAVVVHRRLMLSDVTCLIGYILAMAYSTTAFQMTRWGLGYHEWEVTQYNYSQILKWLFTGSVIYIPASYFIKVTILLLIARVFAVEKRIVKGVHFFIFFLLFAYTPIQTLKTMICIPIRAYWEPLLVPKYGCISQRGLFIADLVVALVADLIIITVPIPVTITMRVPLRKKLKIMFMLSAGSLATGVTIFRLVKVIGFLKTDDVTAGFVALDLTTLLELTVGLICACLPAANFLYERSRSRRRRRRAAPEPEQGRRRAPRQSASSGSWWSMIAHLRTRADDQDEHVHSVNDGRDRGQDMSKAECTGAMADLEAARREAQRAFDLELACFTGEAVHVGGEEGRLGISRATSNDGRREGWLAPESGGGGTGMEGRLVRYWSHIWDGPRDDVRKNP